MSLTRPPGVDLMDDLIARAKRAGADDADAVLFERTSIEVGQRLGKPETVERAESREAGLRVLIGRSQAIVSITDPQPDRFDALVEQAVAMARAVPEDPYVGLADPADLAKSWPDIESADPSEPATETLIEAANACEDAARAIGGVSNSEGASASYSKTGVVLVASNGFSGAYAVTRHALSVSVLAGEGVGMERDYAFSAKAFREDLPSPESIGREAGERVVARLNPRKAKTARVPVVMEPRIARGMVGHVSSAINGSSIARGTSFLKDKMGQKIFADGIAIVDDPHLKRGLRSSPFDAEGIAPERRFVVEDGILKSWFLDLRSARKLGLESTGHASRGASGGPSPSPSNLWLMPGTVSREDLIRDIDQGLYVTFIMGQGVNQVTGDYSRGAGGFWIENGEIAYPVSEITIAGNLNEMFLNLTPADDLEHKYGVDAPTLRIDGCTVAGS